MCIRDRDEDGKIIWNNNAFSRVIHNEKALRKSVTSFFSSVTRDRLPSEEEGIVQFELSYDDSEYAAKFTRISLREAADDSDKMCIRDSCSTRWSL